LTATHGFTPPFGVGHTSGSYNCVWAVADEKSLPIAGSIYVGHAQPTRNTLLSLALGVIGVVVGVVVVGVVAVGDGVVVGEGVVVGDVVVGVGVGAGLLAKYPATPAITITTIIIAHKVLEVILTYTSTIIS